jgi:hypothetical protein
LCWQYLTCPLDLQFFLTKLCFIELYSIMLVRLPE